MVLSKLNIFGSRPAPNFRILAFRALFSAFTKLRLLSIRSTVRQLKHGNSQLQSELKQLKAIGKPLLKKLAFETMESVLQISIENSVYLTKEKSMLPNLEGYDIQRILQKWRSSKIYDRAILQVQSLINKAKRRKDSTKNRKKIRKQKSNQGTNNQSGKLQQISKVKDCKHSTQKNNDLQLKIKQLSHKAPRKDFKQARKDIKSTQVKLNKQEKDFICRDYQIHPSWAAKLQRQKLQNLKPQGKAVKLC